MARKIPDGFIRITRNHKPLQGDCWLPANPIYKEPIPCFTAIGRIARYRDGEYKNCTLIRPVA